MAALSEKAVSAFGENIVLSSVPYSGQTTSFQVDARASSAAVIAPAGGPTATLGTASGGLNTVTLSAGGANQGGAVIVATAYGKVRAGHKPA